MRSAEPITRIVEREAHRVDLLGVRVDGMSQPATVAYILGALAQGDGGWLVTLNVDILRKLFRNPILRMLVERADLVLADGMPIVWACHVMGIPVADRVAGADLLWTLSEGAARAHRSVFVLGGEPGTAAEAGERLRGAFPGLEVCGGYSPPWGFERSDDDMRDMIDELGRAAPDIVFCGLGFPKQERLILELTETFPRTWFVGSGASHVFASGRIRRAPRWMQRLGLEWCHRLLREPRRLFRRYLRDDLPFALWLLAGSYLCRRTPRSGAPRRGGRPGGPRGTTATAEMLVVAGAGTSEDHRPPRECM